MLPMYCGVRPLYGFGPCGLAAEATPLPLATKIRLPSLLALTEVGYQPVGMKPSTSLLPRLATSTTATSLLSAFAMWSVFSSGESATALGVLPMGDFGCSAVEIASISFICSVETTETVLLLALAT